MNEDHFRIFSIPLSNLKSTESHYLLASLIFAESMNGEFRQENKHDFTRQKAALAADGNFRHLLD